MRKLFLLPLTALFALTACQKQELDVAYPESDARTGLREVILSAEMEEESSPDTRTVLILDETVNPPKQRLYWLPSDTIKVFSAGEAAMFVSINTEPSRKAKFRGQVSFIIGDDGESEKEYVWGLYPYREDAQYSEPDGSTATAVITTTLPDVQTGKPGTFASGLATMIGRSESLTLSYKAAYSGVYIRFNRDDIVSVTLRGRHDEVLAGRFVLGLDDHLDPEVKSIVSGSTSVTVYAPDGGTFEPGENYYLVTLPDVQLEEGYSLTVNRSDGMVATFNSLTTVRNLPRNGCRNFTNPLDTYIENENNIASGRSTGWTRPENEIWYTSARGAVVEYSVDGDTGNEVVENIPPSENGGRGIIRFAAPLVEIDESAFENNYTTLTSVNLPNTVEKIKDAAFSNCYRLSSVTLGNDLKSIGVGSFQGCESLEAIHLPEGLTDIDYLAFDSCTSLKSIRIPDSVTKIGYWNTTYPVGNPFSGCTSLERFEGKFVSDDGKCIIVDLPGGSTGILISFATGWCDEYSIYAVPENVKQFRVGAFSEATFGHVVLPEGLTHVFDWAFFRCVNLKEVSVPENVWFFGSSVFKQCSSLESITLKMSSVPAVRHTLLELGHMFDNTGDCDIFVPQDLLETYKTSDYWSDYSERYQPIQGLDEIRYTTTDGQPITLPSGIQATNTYSNGKGVVKFDSAVTEIPDRMFEQCTTLATVSLPNSVLSIGNYSFNQCYALESVNFGSGLQSIGSFAFGECHGLVTVILPEGLTFLDAKAFDNDTALTSVYIPESLATIGVNPFRACSSLVSFAGNNSMISDDGRCLINSGTLVSFAPCMLSETVYSVPETVSSIGDLSMQSGDYQTVILPETVTSIGWGAFSHSTLGEINIPASVSSISGFAFSDCQDLYKVKMEGTTPPSLGSGVFEDSSDDFKIAIPGAGALSYTDYSDYPDWYALRLHFSYYQTDKEIWIHLVGNENSVYQLRNTDFGDGIHLLNGSKGPIEGHFSSFEPCAEFPESLRNDYLLIVIYPFDGVVTRVPDGAFHLDTWNERLDYISVPETVTEFGDEAFKDCSNLLAFPFDHEHGGNLARIGNDAFNGCSSMSITTNVTPDEFPDAYMCFNDHLSSIGDRAFKKCSSLNLPIMSTHSLTIGQDAFENSSLPKAYFNNTTSIDQGAFSNCSSLTYAFIGPVTEIKDSTFFKCKKLVNVKLKNPGSMTTLGKYAFYGCNVLKTINSELNGEVVLPAVTSIGDYAFSDDLALDVIRLPELKTTGMYSLSTLRLNVLELPKLEKCSTPGNSVGYVFSNLKIDELYLPSIKTLTGRTFGYSSIKSIHFGPGLQNFPLCQFVDVTSKPDLYFEGTTPPTFNSSAFYLGSSNHTLVELSSIHVPSGCRSAYLTALTNANSDYSAYADIIVED